MTHPLHRRRLLAGVTGLLTAGALAGCSESDDESAPNQSAADGSDSTESTAEELDLREANVVDVAFEATGGSYEFDVTLHHDDDGEAGYANWWQVERLDGTRLGRRELLHAHSEQPFTRSATVEIPDDVACVIVRGHDETHGYGGRAAAVDLASGTSRSVDQGPERRPIDPGECPTG